VFWCIVVALVLASFPYPLNVNFRDEVMMMGGAYRVFLGQIPHVDFSHPTQPVSFLLIAFGFLFSGISMDAFLIGKLLIFTLILICAWSVGRSRLERSPCILLSCFLSLAVFLPRYLCVTDLSHAYFYNRIGYPLIGLILFEALSKPLAALDQKREFLDGGVSGVLLALLVLIKQNFFGVACGALFVGWVLLKRTRARNLGLLAGFTLIIGLYLTYVRFQLGAIARDWIFTFWLLGEHTSSRGQLLEVIRGAFRGYYLVLYLLLIGVLLYRPRTAIFRISARWAILLIFLFLVAVHFFIASTSFDVPSHLFVVLFTFLAFQLGLSKCFSQIASIIQILLIAPIGITAFAALLYPIWVNHKYRPMKADLPVTVYYSKSEDRPRINGFDDPKALTQLYQEGLNLLKPMVTPSVKILTFSFGEAFPMFFKTEPPRGIRTYWYKEEDRPFNPNLAMTPEIQFAHADLIIAAKDSGSLQRRLMPGMGGVLDIYRDELRKNWKLVNESENWLIYERPYK
jgi:hypothetical protein